MGTTTLPIIALPFTLTGSSTGLFTFVAATFASLWPFVALIFAAVLTMGFFLVLRHNATGTEIIEGQFDDFEYDDYDDLFD
jgi:hypothetical protein